MNTHPRAVGTTYVVIGAVWIAVDLSAHEPGRLVFPVLFTLAGITWFGRAVLTVDGSVLTVPNRWWGARKVQAHDIEAIEIPVSVWSTAASWLALRGGERVLLRGADRQRARQLADELSLAVVPVGRA